MVGGSDRKTLFLMTADDFHRDAVLAACSAKVKNLTNSPDQLPVIFHSYPGRIPESLDGLLRVDSSLYEQLMISGKKKSRPGDGTALKARDASGNRLHH